MTNILLHAYGKVQAGGPMTSSLDCIEERGAKHPKPDGSDEIYPYGNLFNILNT